MLGIIGGSGLGELTGFSIDEKRWVDTRWGRASAPVQIGTLGRARMAFLPRHGEGHVVPPHRINYRANIAALKAAGITHIIAVAAVGGIAPDCVPGALVVPDQIIDYTAGREATYFTGDDGKVVHIDFSQPYDDQLRVRLLRAAQRLAEPVVDGGVYGCTNGPRLETAAEIRRMSRDGCTLVGMTGMPEAALARELELHYASLCVVANAAAGLSDEPLTMDAILSVLRSAMSRAMKVLVAVASDEASLA